jgi:DNA-binding FrmR family transcriptional regulator
VGDLYLSGNLHFWTRFTHLTAEFCQTFGRFLATCKKPGRSNQLAAVKLLVMAITDDNRDKLKARLSKAIGHLNAVYKMVDEQKYCIDILNQLKAVQSALDKSAELMLKDHLNTCVVEAVHNNDSARVMEELWQLLKRGSEDDESQPKAEAKDCCKS